MNNALPWLSATNGPKKPGRIWPEAVLLVFAAFTFPSPSAAQTPIAGNTFLEPYQSIEISSINTGVIKAIQVKQGDFVKAGQALITLDSEIIEAHYEVAKARAENQGQIMARRAERDQQSHRYNMLVALKAGGHSGNAELYKEHAMLKAAEGNLKAAEEEQKIAVLEALRIRAELNQRILRTPIDGYVVSINRDVAEPVGPGLRSNNPDEPDYLIRVVEVSRLKATAFLPYKDVKRLKEGASLTVTGVDSEDQWQTQGKIEFISPIIFAATGLVEVRVAIDNANLTHKSGVPAQVLTP